MMLWARFRRYWHLLRWCFSPWRWSTVHQAITHGHGFTTTDVLCSCGRRWV